MNIELWWCVAVKWACEKKLLFFFPIVAILRMNVAKFSCKKTSEVLPPWRKSTINPL